MRGLVAAGPTAQHLMQIDRMGSPLVGDVRRQGGYAASCRQRARNSGEPSISFASEEKWLIEP
jgi:hypothetical protein